MSDDIKEALNRIESRLDKLEERISKLNDEVSSVKERVSKLEAVLKLPEQLDKEKLLTWLVRVLMLILLAKLGVTYGQ